MATRITSKMIGRVTTLNILAFKYDQNHSGFVIVKRSNGFQLGLKIANSDDVEFIYGDTVYPTASEFYKHLDSIGQSYSIYKQLFISE